MFFKKLKAGALQYTIFISVIIVLLVTAFIGLTYLNQKTRIKSLFFKETINNSNSSFNYVASHDILYNQNTEIAFSEEIENSVTLIKKHWGVFDVVLSNSKIKNEHFEKIALMGGNQFNRPALYLKDDNKPLVLVGNTKIIGSALLPKKGVRRGNIAGKSYYGSTLIYGNTYESSASLPKIVNKDYLQQLTKESFSNTDFERFEPEQNTTLIHPFSNKTLLFEQESSIDLQFTNLTGNIIIQSHEKIAISKSAELHDIILIAPIIEIKDGVSGNFQAFATEQIVIGAQCNLEYPSALILNEKIVSVDETAKKEQPSKLNQIKISSNAVVKGVIAFLSEDTSKNYQPQILIEKEALIVGEVYCERNINLQGTVEGTIYTHSFITKQFGATYSNHIFNGRIIEPDLPQQYCGLQFSNSHQNVVKWLY